MARSIADLYWVMFGAAVVVLAIVVGALVIAGIRFRERPGHQARQYHGNNVLELIWTVVPTLMVIAFSVLSFQRLALDLAPGKYVLICNVAGHYQLGMRAGLELK